MRISIIVILSFLVYSCNQSGCGGEKLELPIGQNVDVDGIIERTGRNLPDACSIIPLSLIADILEIEENRLNITDSTPGGDDPTNTSCFFQWDDPGVVGAGILIQAFRNPEPEYYTDFGRSFIEAKRHLGEQDYDGSAVLFDVFEGFGDGGAYSPEVGKVFWHLGEKIVFGISFNTSFSPEKQFNAARRLAYEITQSYMEN